MMFPCLPVSNEHECCIVQHFVGRYNERNGTAYRVVSFPELDSRNSKEPEALLETPGEGPRLAIERKSIVHPLDQRYMAKHRNEHFFRVCFREQLNAHGCDYSASLYHLEVHERDLSSKRQKEIPGIAEQVAAAVACNWLRIDENFPGIRGKTPIQWQFRIIQPEERDYDFPESGILITVILESPLSEPPEKVEEELAGYAKEFESQAAKAAEKFVQYTDYQKLLLVQFFGDSLGEVGDGEIIEIIRSASLPPLIDEVWVAREEWVGLDESEIHWDRARQV